MVEKRRYVRIDHPIRVRYELEGEEKTAGEAISKNIGGRGVCLVLNRFFTVGSSLRLILKVPGVYPAVEVRAKVIWVNKLLRKDKRLGGNTEVGLQYTSLSSTAKASIVNFIYESLKRRDRKCAKPISS